MPKNAKALPILTPDQKEIIAEHWQMEIGDLTRKVFPDQPELDRRSIECKAVRVELAILGRGNSRTVISTNTTAGLSPEDQEYVKNNYKNASPLEMARMLSGDANLLVNSPQCRQIEVYCRSIDSNFRRDEEMAEGPYRPPSNVTQLINKVNRYAINPRHDDKPLYDPNNLSNQDQKQLRSLLSYVQKPLFKIEGDKCIRKSDRELFESTFVSFCWNKAELMDEEVHQYIAVASETVRYTQIDRMVAKLDERLSSTLEVPDSQMRMADVELLTSLREKSNASSKKISDMTNILIGKRADRLKNQIQSSAALYNLVTSWRNQDDRRRIIQTAAKQKGALAAEIERLSTMDAIKAEIFGLDRADILR